MRSKAIITLLTIFTIATISLIAVQIVQSRKTAETNDDLFNISMSSAMDNVFQQFDKMKPEEYVNGKEKYTVSTTSRIDDMNNKMAQLISEHEDLFYDIERIEFNVALRDSVKIRRNTKLAKYEQNYISQYNTILSARNRLSKELNTNDGNKQYQLTQENFNYSLLESIIDQELIIKGIDVKPMIGVYCTSTNEFLYTSPGVTESTLKNTPHRYSFKLTQVPLSYEYSIMLSFPSRYSFIQSTEIVLTLMSVFLLLTIFITFFISIKIVYKMKALDEMKTTFINNMTHEIKTPISTIGLTCEMLNDPSINNDNEMRRNFVNTIADENKRMKTLVETILQNSKMTDKNFTLHCKDTSLNVLTAEVASSFKLRIKNRDGEMIEEYDEGLPNIYADEVHVVTMISNLIDNAIKYSKNKPYIKISTKRDGDMALLSVEDHGIGISKEDQKHIFEKFYRVSTGNVHDVKGFGIGLNHVANVVARHHGTVKVESEPDEGSTFTIALPII